MATLIESHVCPNCRVQNESWQTKGPDEKLKRLRKKPDWLEDGQEATNTCPSCNESYTGRVQILPLPEDPDTLVFADVRP